jgi:nitrate reductase NapE component
MFRLAFETFALVTFGLFILLLRDDEVVDVGLSFGFLVWI